MINLGIWETAHPPLPWIAPKAFLRDARQLEERSISCLNATKFVFLKVSVTLIRDDLGEN